MKNLKGLNFPRLLCQAIVSDGMKGSGQIPRADATRVKHMMGRMKSAALTLTNRDSARHLGNGEDKEQTKNRTYASMHGYNLASSTESLINPFFAVLDAYFFRAVALGG